MQCTHCGQLNADGARFCARCGQLLGVPSATSSQPNSAPQFIVPPQNVSPPTTSAIPFQAPRPVDASTRPQSPAPSNSGSNAGSKGGFGQGKRQQQKGLAATPQMIMPLLCRLCGQWVPGGKRACLACGTPIGLIANPNDASASTYLPARLAYPFPGDAIDAGNRSTTLPPEIAARRWHWGAFGLTTLWLFLHRLYLWGTLSLILGGIATWVLISGMTTIRQHPAILLSFVGTTLALSALMSIHGYSLAWEQAKQQEPLTLLKQESRWRWAGRVSAFVKVVVLAGATMMALLHR